MHDDLLERRLRATLHDEAARQPFTITPAELERRAVLHTRRSGGRLGLLLAAAVAIGGLGVAGAIGALVNDPSPSPVAQSTTGPTVSPGPPILPSLDALLGADVPGVVVFAQSHGPAEGPEPFPGVVSLVLPAPFVEVGGLSTAGTHTITFACLGGNGDVVVIPEGDVRVLPGAAGTPCDGRPHDQTVRLLSTTRSLYVAVSQPSSWRLVVRRQPTTTPTLPPNPATLVTEGDQEELVSAVDETTDGGVVVDGLPGLVRNVGAVAERLVYVGQASCLGDTLLSSMQFGFGDDTGGTVTTTTMTLVPCDGLAHRVTLGIPQPNGSQIFAAASPATRWSLLLTSETPPVALPEPAGWMMSAGYGPSLNISGQHGVSMTGGDEEHDRVLVALACTGTEPIEVSVDASEPLGDRFETFLAECAPGGAETTRIFEVKRGALVQYTAPFFEWTALSLLVPAPAGAGD